MRFFSSNGCQLGKRVLTILLILPLLCVSYAWSDDSTTRLSLPLYKSEFLLLDKRPSRVSVGNPEIADIVLLRSKQIHVVGRSLGSTNVVFWDASDTIFQTVNIEITHDLQSLKEKLHTMMPGEPIRVYSAADKLILEGEVSSATSVSAAMKVASGYLPECRATQTVTKKSSIEGMVGGRGSCGNSEVVNLMKVVGSQQIMLEVKVAEISRTLLRSFDTDLTLLNFSGNRQIGAVNGGADLPIPTGGGIPAAGSIADKGLFFQQLTGSNFFQAALELSRSKGLAKILAEPTLTTLTGRPATFVSGGEIPVPVPEDGRTSIQFKDFGVKVQFLPTILEQGRISLDLDIAVSELTQTQPISVTSEGSSGLYVIPSLSKRGVTSTVELANGQTIGIAGLIQDNVREVYTQMPGIGDLPVIGNLFRSQEFISGQTELVIFVTAHLAKPIAADKVRLPTESFIPPSDVEFYLLGQMEGRETVPESDRIAPSLTGGTEGLAFGHDL